MRILTDTNANVLGGNHLSDTTCLTHVFFKSGEPGSTLNEP